MGANTSLLRCITKAKTNKRPLIVVEAMNDVKFYENIIMHIVSQKDKKVVDILPIQTIISSKNNLGTSRCTAIVTEFTNIQRNFMK